jgi:hypothetical protein
MRFPANDAISKIFDTKLANIIDWRNGLSLAICRNTDDATSEIEAILNLLVL